MRGWLNWAGGGLVLLLFGFMTMMFGRNPDNRPVELFLVGCFFAVISYAVAVPAMFSYVEVSAATVVVVNPGSAYRIPWSAVRTLSAANGLSIELTDGRKVDCFAFQSSSVGRMLGYPGARRAVRKLEQVRSRGVAVDPRVHPDPVVPWRRHVFWSVGLWATFAVVIPWLVRLAPDISR